MSSITFPSIAIRLVRGWARGPHPGFAVAAEPEDWTLIRTTPSGATKGGGDGRGPRLAPD